MARIPTRQPAEVRLKKYLDQERKPQELIENAVSTLPLPFTLSTSDAQLDSTLRQNSTTSLAV